MFNFENIPLRDILKQSIRLINDSEKEKWIINNDSISGLKLPFLYETVDRSEKAHQMGGQDYFKIGMCLRGNSFLQFEDHAYVFESENIVVALPGRSLNELPIVGSNYATLWICLSPTGRSMVYLIREYLDEPEHLYDFCYLDNLDSQDILIGNITFEINKGKLFHIDKVREHIKKAVAMSFQLLDEKKSEKIPQKPNKVELINEAKKYINENYSCNIRIDNIAKKLHVSGSYLHAVFKPAIGRTVTQYIEHLRIAKARELLKSTEQTIKSISSQLGYYDECHFSKYFKKNTGYSPDYYRKHKGIIEPPELPWEYIDTTYIQPSDKKILVRKGDDLQAAFENAMPGDTIELQAGAVFTGCFTLPRKDGDEWIYIQSSEYSKLPAPGNRVSPSDRVNMPMIITTKTDDFAAVTITNGAHHYRFSGIEMTCTHDITTDILTAIVRIQYDSNKQNFTSSDIPHDIIFDRCYIHGTPTGNLKRGIIISGSQISIIDSYISECHDISESAQAILCFKGPGPLKIVNNHLESSGENILFGGLGSENAAYNPSDIEIRHNYFFKPFTWHQNHKSYNKIHWVIKNLLEIKNAQRVLLDGNVFENCWVDDHSGNAIWIKLEDELYTNWHVCQDITFVNNIIINSASGFYIIGYAAVGRSSKHNWGQRLLIKNNLIHINDFETENKILFKIKNNFSDLTIEHNTFVNYGQIIVCDGLPNYNFVFRNNICASGLRGNTIKGVDHGDGNDTLLHYFPGYEFEGNVIDGCKASDYPSGNYFPETLHGDFINFSDTDYRLADNSKYKGAGTDGMDLGADIRKEMEVDKTEVR